ncbi:hypothetical protein C8R44DRAFT_752228 [Mycena epipterygia]|nr:hypothetical protein C8R44DRAFT_752228 [Mycena epipterygia]
MLRSFLQALVCFPNTAEEAEYDPLQTLESTVWPAVSLPMPMPPLVVGPIARLPPELVHLIISYVDPTMLASCSLVCARWMAIARPRMFSRISIALCNAHRFGRLFVPPARASFESHVREIELDHKIVGDFWTSHVLPKFIVNFPHLTTLSLCRIVPKSLPSAFQVVTHLEMHYICTAHPDRLAGFISSFPRLETLKLTQPEELKGPYFNFGIMSAVRRPPPRLRRVDLDSPLILQWITSAVPQPPIEEIRLEISHPETMIAVESIRSLSTSLRALDLTLSDLDVAASFLAKPHLATLTQLHTLRIQADHSLAAPILLALLSPSAPYSLDTSALSSITLDFAIPYLDSPVLSLLPWAELDSALAALPSLRSLAVGKVLVSPEGWRSRINQRAVLREARERMPLCTERDFGVGASGLEAGERERAPSRAAGTPRHLSDLCTGY